MGYQGEDVGGVFHTFMLIPQTLNQQFTDMKFKSTFLAIVSTFLIASCTPDNCKDVVCLNASVCDDGTCLCTDWYEGTECGDEQRVKYYGTYYGTVITTLPDNTTDTQNATFVIGSRDGGVNFMDIDGLDGVLTTNNLGEVECPLQSFYDANLGNIYMSGMGSFNGSQFIFNYQYEISGDVFIATFSGTK